MEGKDLGCTGTRGDGLFLSHISEICEYVALGKDMGHFAVSCAKRVGERPEATSLCFHISMECDVDEGFGCLEYLYLIALFWNLAKNFIGFYFIQTLKRSFVGQLNDTFLVLSFFLCQILKACCPRTTRSRSQIVYFMEKNIEFFYTP